MEPVSIIIPAYNKPDYLRAAVESLLDQSYESLEIIVSDDNSPIDLSGCLDGLPFDAKKTLTLYRNNRNLGPYWNAHEARRHVRSKYLMFLPHDDYLVDRDFISDSMSIFQNHSDCSVVIGNTIIENTDVMMMPINFEPFVRYDGNSFMAGPLWQSLHPSYSGVILDYTKVMTEGYVDFVLSEDVCKRLHLEPDEFFISIMLAAQDSAVYISGKLVSVRGNPSDSYSKSVFWRRRGNLSCFISQYQLFRYFKLRNNELVANRIMKNILVRTPVESLSFAPFKIIGYEKSALFLFVASFLFGKLRFVLRFPYVFLFLLRHLLLSVLRRFILLGGRP